MTDADLAKHIATLPAYACGCTVNHVGRCPKAWELWEKVKKLWKDYHGTNGREAYFAATRKYLAHFENSHAPAPEPVAEAERAQMELL